MLKNASTLAIVGLDTAENGPSKVRQVTNRIDAIIEENLRARPRQRLLRLRVQRGDGYRHPRPAAGPGILDTVGSRPY